MVEPMELWQRLGHASYRDWVLAAQRARRSAWSRYGIHQSMSFPGGGPDLPPHPGFRDGCITQTNTDRHESRPRRAGGCPTAARRYDPIHRTLMLSLSLSLSSLIL